MVRSSVNRDIVIAFVRRALDARRASLIAQQGYESLAWGNGGDKAFSAMVQHRSMYATCLLAAKMLAKHLR